MSHKPIFIAILVLALVSLACNAAVNFPVTDVKTGPTQTEDINIPVPSSASTTDLTLAFGAGVLKVSPGSQDALVSGTATYNVQEVKPVITNNGNSVRIQSGDLKINGIPNFGKDFKNEWDLKLGNSPMNLHISAGAYQGQVELGGLSLQSLDVGDGAADVNLSFSEPNQVEMSSLRYETGASNVKLSGLANANFSSMVFRSGAGDYTLDFSGDLKQDASVSVTSGVSHVVIIVPQGVSAQVVFKGGLSNVNTQGSWQKSGDNYTLSGSGSTLNISVDMGAGSLELRNN